MGVTNSIRCGQRTEQVKTLTAAIPLQHRFPETPTAHHPQHTCISVDNSDTVNTEGFSKDTSNILLSHIGNKGCSRRLWTHLNFEGEIPVSLYNMGTSFPSKGYKSLPPVAMARLIVPVPFCQAMTKPCRLTPSSRASLTGFTRRICTCNRFECNLGHRQLAVCMK